jgi:hypothetical protein
VIGRFFKSAGERLSRLKPTGLSDRARSIRFPSGLGSRLRSVRYLMGDVAYLIGRPFRSLGDRLRPVWGSVSPANRRRLGVGLAAIAVIAVVAIAVVPNLPCAAPGGDECAPPDDAIALAPADTLAYVHVNIERGTDQADAAAAAANRTPLLTQQILGRVLPFFPSGGEGLSFSEDVEPWFGGELALAVVPGGAGTEQVQMLEVAETEGAREYEESIGAGSPEPEDYQGVDLREDERGLATAIVEDFLVVGSADGVRSVIDAAVGADGAESLDGDSVASEAIDALPEARFAEAYLSTEGIDSFLAISDGALASFEPLVDSGDSQGVAFGLSADDTGFQLASRSLLDPERNPEAGGFFAAFDPFTPELPSELAPDTLAYAGFGNADETVSDLLEQATFRAPSIATGVTGLVDRLRKDAGVDIASELLPALNGEGALAVAPRPDPTAASAEPTKEEDEATIEEDEVPDGLQPPGAPETVAPGPVKAPYAAFLAADVDEEAASDALARLQGELAGSVDPKLADPIFREETLGGVTAQVLQRSPVDVLAYGISEGMLAIADDRAPVERLGSDSDSGLAGAEGYESAVESLAEQPDFITYLDLAGLVATAERLGAGAEGPFATFAEDLRRLQTFALTVLTEEDTLSTDSRLRIAAP